jgi:large subunit ribosomal protein L25
MEKVVIKATKRAVTGKHVATLRREGKLPGVLYGHNVNSVPITMDLKETSTILGKLSGSSIVTIDLDGHEHAALVREKQRDYIRSLLIHVDFQAVSLTEKLRTDVGIELIGASPAVKDFNAMIVSGIEEVVVECLPQDLPEKIEVDISNLKAIGDSIYLRDIPVPQNVVFLTDPNELIAVAQFIKEEVVEAPAVVETAEVAGTEPEVIEKGKKEEEGEEGESKEGKSKEGKAA